MFLNLYINKIKYLHSLLLIILFVPIIYLGIYDKTIASETVNFGGYTYTEYSVGEQVSVEGAEGTYSLETKRLDLNQVVGAHTRGARSNSVSDIIVKDASGSNFKLIFDDSGRLNYIQDSKNNKIYEVAATGGATIISTEIKEVLREFSLKSNYEGDLYEDTIQQRNIFYNNQLIAKLQSGEKCDTDSDATRRAVAIESSRGRITDEEKDRIFSAMQTGIGWTPALAEKFKGALNQSMGSIDTYFSYEYSQMAIECAFISAASQDDKDKAIATLQEINRTGKKVSDLTSDQLDNLVRTVNAGVTSGGGIGSAVQVATDVSGTVNAAADRLAETSLEQCIAFGGDAPYFHITPSACFAEILYFILSILAFFLGIVGVFFNLIFDTTLVNMSANVDRIGIVTAGWVTIRDFANILFIFMLLYLAISTILQLDEHGVKHGLSRLIIGAVLINFSLFFVKIPIDISNILAIEIYDTITVNGNNTIENDGSVGLSFGLGDAILAMFSPQQVFHNSSLDPKTIVSAGGKDPGFIGWNLQENPVTTFAMGIIIIFTSLLVFLAVCIIFIKRFITLIMLMIFSPLAFAGMAIPNHNIEHMITEKFWTSLLKESFYAPVFMFMMYLTIRTGEAINSIGLKGSEGFFANLSTVPVTNVISYSVVMGMMIFSLTVSETMGVKGASGAIKFFDGARSSATDWTWKNTGGQLAYNLLEKSNFGSKTLKGLRQGLYVDKDGNSKRISNPLLRGIARGVGNTVTGGLSKAGEGHHHDVEKDVKSTLDTMNELRDSPEQQAALIAEMMAGHARDLGKNFTGTVHPYDQKVAKYVGTSMKDDEVATLALYMRKQGKSGEEAAETLISYLGKERRANIEEMTSNKVTKFHRNELGEQAHKLDLISQYNKTADKTTGKGGTVTANVDGHGPKKLDEDATLKYFNELGIKMSEDPSGKTVIDEKEILNSVEKMYSGFSEKQKTDIFSTLSNSQQKALAGNEDFTKQMEKHFTNYRMMDQAMKGSMAKELLQKLGEIAYKGVSKYNIDTVLRSEDFKKLSTGTDEEKEKYNKVSAALKDEWRRLNDNKEWQEKYDEVVDPDTGESEDSLMQKKINEYKTLVQAKQNFTRVAAEDADFKRISELTSGKTGDSSWLPKI